MSVKPALLALTRELEGTLGIRVTDLPMLNLQ
jgi:hypothetical protein